MPSTPPSSRPITTTATSRAVRTSRSDSPVRRAEPGHQAVARAATELRTDVEGAGQSAQQHAAEHQRDARRRVRPAPSRTARVSVGGEADDDRVADRAEAGHLAQRDPQHQHDEAEQDDRLAQGHRHVADEARVEHVPRREAERPAHHHRQRDAVQEQPDEELGQAAGEPAGAQLARSDRAWARGRGPQWTVEVMAAMAIPEIGLVRHSQSWNSGLHEPCHQRPARSHSGRRLPPLPRLPRPGREPAGADRRRPHRSRRTAAERARAHRRARRLAHHGHAGLRGAARVRATPRRAAGRAPSPACPAASAAPTTAR